MDQGHEQEFHLKTGAQPHSSSAQQDKTVALSNLSDCQNYALQTSAHQAWRTCDVLAMCQAPLPLLSISAPLEPHNVSEAGPVIILILQKRKWGLLGKVTYQGHSARKLLLICHISIASSNTYRFVF